MLVCVCVCVVHLHVYHCGLYSRLFDKPPEFVLDSVQLKTIIVQSLLSLHGQVWSGYLCVEW